MKIRTSDLTGAALDWAVMIALGHKVFPAGDLNVGKFGPLFGKTEYGAALGVRRVRPSTDWAQGGPIIEREEIGTKRRMPSMRGEEWEAAGSIGAKGAGYRHAVGPTPLIAVMRCYVSSKLGDEVEVPDELLEGALPPHESDTSWSQQ